MGKIVIRYWILSAVALLLPLICGHPVLGQQSPAKDDKAAPKAKPAQPPAKEKAAPAQPEKAAVPSLKELLTQALKENPDIRVAETKLREAEANLNRTRLQVTQKVVALHQTLKSQQAQIEAAEANYKYAEANLNRFTQLYKTGGVKLEVMDEKKASLEAAKAALMTAKATLAQTEAELPYLLGQYPQPPSSNPKAEEAWREAEDALRLELQAQSQSDELRAKEITLEALKKRRQSASPPLPSAMADKIRKALNTPVTCEASPAPLADVLTAFGEKTGISFHIKDIGGGIGDLGVRLRLKEAVPLAAALQAIGDFLPDVRFVVRDYGILVADKVDLPPGTVLVETFWKAEQAKEKPTGSPPQGQKPAPPPTAGRK